MNHPFNRIYTREGVNNPCTWHASLHISNDYDAYVEATGVLADASPEQRAEKMRVLFKTWEDRYAARRRPNMLRSLLLKIAFGYVDWQYVVAEFDEEFGEDEDVENNLPYQQPALIGDQFMPADPAPPYRNDPTRVVAEHMMLLDGTLTVRSRIKSRLQNIPANRPARYNTGYEGVDSARGAFLVEHFEDLCKSDGDYSACSGLVTWILAYVDWTYIYQTVLGFEGDLLVHAEE